MKRRALMLSMLATTLAGCGGETSAPVTATPTPPVAKAPTPTPTVPPTTVTPPAPAPTPAREWVVTVPTLLPGQSYSIPTPEGARTGGTFGVSDTGTPLPDYIKLTPQGILSVDLTAPSGQTVGVIFFYDEPA